MPDLSILSDVRTAIRDLCPTPSTAMLTKDRIGRIRSEQAGNGIRVDEQPEAVARELALRAHFDNSP